MEPVIIKVGYLVQAGGGSLPAGTEGQFLAYGAGGVPVAVDAPAGGYDDTALSARVDTAQERADAAYALAQQGGGGSAYDDTELRGIATSAQSDASQALADAAAAQADADANAAAIASLPAPYDDTALEARVADVEADVVTAQSRADAAYSLAQQGGGTGAYDDTEVRGLIGAVDSKADANAAAIAAFGPTDWADITNKPTTFTPSAHTHAYADITGKPSTFAPSAHTHAISEVTGLQTALDGKAASAHTHAIADVTGLQTALDGKQPTMTFKTVNNTAITGTGNIDIPAGPPPPVVVTATVPASPVAGTFYVVTT